MAGAQLGPRVFRYEVNWTLMQEMSAGFSADKGAQEGRGVTSEKVDVIFYVVVNFSQNIKNNILIFSSTAAFDQRR